MRKWNKNLPTSIITVNLVIIIIAMVIWKTAIAWIQEARKQEAVQGDVSLEEKGREVNLRIF